MTNEVIEEWQSKPEKVRDYYPGKGCTCAALTEYECACDVDWTDPEVYKLLGENEFLRGRVQELVDTLEAAAFQFEDFGHVSKADACRAVLNKDT